MITASIAGIAGSYSEEAANQFLGPRAVLHECSSFDDVFQMLANGQSRTAILPVFNRIIGRIESVERLLCMCEYTILAKVRLRIGHVLAGVRNAVPSQIREVRSHSAALDQCRRFIEAMNVVDIVSEGDTARAIKQVVEDNDPSVAAICSFRAANLYGAKLLERNIADQNDNWTEFWMISTPHSNRRETYLDEPVSIFDHFDESYRSV